MKFPFGTPATSEDDLGMPLFSHALTYVCNPFQRESRLTLLAEMMYRPGIKAPAVMTAAASVVQ